MNYKDYNFTEEDIICILRRAVTHSIPDDICGFSYFIIEIPHHDRDDYLFTIKYRYDNVSLNGYFHKDVFYNEVIDIIRNNKINMILNDE